MLINYTRSVKMPIINVKTDEIGESGIVPRIIRIETNNTLSEVLTKGYLTSISKQFLLYESDLAVVTTKPTPNSRETNVGVFELAFDPTDQSWSLQATAQPGNVVLPTQAGRIAVFLDAVGTIGMLADPAFHETDIQAGFNGSAGDLVSYPPGANNGLLRLRAVDGPGNFNTTIINDVLRTSSSTIAIPDVANTNGSFLTAGGTVPFVDGHYPVAVGTKGRMKDSGAKLISGTTLTYGGGGTSNNFVITGMTAAHVGACVIRTSTNPVSIVKATPGVGILAIQFSADPGAATTLDYIYTSAAQV